MTTKFFGEPITRREDPRLVSGHGKYLDDLGQDALEAAFVRSPHAVSYTHLTLPTSDLV